MLSDRDVTFATVIYISMIWDRFDSLKRIRNNTLTVRFLLLLLQIIVSLVWDMLFINGCHPWSTGQKYCFAVAIYKLYDIHDSAWYQTNTMYPCIKKINSIYCYRVTLDSATHIWLLDKISALLHVYTAFYHCFEELVS